LRAAHAASDGLTIEHVHDGFAGVVGYFMSAENAAMGAVDAESVMKGWMESPGHRANILNPAMTNMGTGRAVSKDLITYWYVVMAHGPKTA
jgi:uncharacterized protein YkwD